MDMFSRLRGLPVFPLAVIVIVIAFGAYLLVRGNDNPEQLSVEVITQTLRPTIAPPEASVAFTGPVDGDTVSNPVQVTMAIGGPGLRYAPAGATDNPDNGHLHVFIDTEPPAPGETIVASDSVLDLADGAHEATLPDLPPGEHTLTLVWSDTNHVVTSPMLSQTITVTVE